MDIIIKNAIHRLSEQSKKIFRGNYSEVGKIYEIDKNGQAGEEIAELIENFGLMAVKLEAREFSLNQKILELEKKQKDLNDLSRLRVDSTYLLVGLIGITSIFSFLLMLIQSVDPGVDKDSLAFYASRATEVVFISLFALYAIRRKMSIRDFGLNAVRAKQSILESVLVTMVIMFLIALLKYVLVYKGIMEQQPIISWAFVNWTFLPYMLVAPLQEFVARGIGQTSIERLLIGKYAWLQAIIGTALVFGMMHLTYSLKLAILSFVGSIIWGYLFHRHKTIIGISISHFLIGLWLGMCGLFS